jgi:ribonuclease P protein component
MTALVWRVRDRQTFVALRSSGRRSRAAGLGLRWLPEDAGPPRLALSVGRAVGSAPIRNRVKRRLREAFRSLAPDLRPGAYLVTAGQSAASTSLTDLEVALRELVADTGAAR